tara:strand:- start:26 stop:454 length:429 start_codon:yes stop_codon:yes gene_type:complete
VKALKALLAAGADVTIGEKDGYTPMHGAGFQGRAEVAKVLIEHGLNPSDRHADGFTPIHRACWGGSQRHAETVRVLLEAGVSHEEKSSNGDTPMEMTKNPHTLQVIQTHLDKLAAAGGDSATSHWEPVVESTKQKQEQKQEL